MDSLLMIIMLIVVWGSLCFFMWLAYKSDKAKADAEIAKAYYEHMGKEREREHETVTYYQVIDNNEPEPKSWLPSNRRRR